MGTENYNAKTYKEFPITHTINAAQNKMVGEFIMHAGECIPIMIIPGVCNI
jgi:hypothetical protein